MKALFASAALAALLAGATTAAADRYHHDDWNHHSDYGNHNGWSSQSDWRPHGHVAYNDWNRAQRVDWRARHLRQPPYGYEWREVDGRYVLAAVATGIIASIILPSH